MIRIECAWLAVQPLDMHAWDFFACLDANFEGDQSRMLGFFEGESEFYPYFDAELRRRVCEKFPLIAEDEDEPNDWQDGEG